MLIQLTTKPGKKYRSLKRPRVYEALRRQGHSKQSAARISNAQAHKTFTLDQLEAFVSSPHYDARTADAIAQGIPALPRLKGEQISPGVTRIHGNLCNVHGRYGPCDAALSGKKKPLKPRKGRKPPKPKQTPEQHAAQRAQQRQANIDSVAKRMAATDTGLAPNGVKALTAFAQGQQPNDVMGQGMVTMGLAEQAADGSYRMTPTGRAVVSAMAAGDYQRAVDGISRGTDASSARQGRTAAHTARQAASQAAHATAATARQARADAAAKRRAEAARKKPAKVGASGSKKPAAQAAEKPLRPAKTPARRAPPSTPSLSNAAPVAPPKPKPAAAAPKPVAPPKAPAKQLAPVLQDAAQSLSDGKELADDDVQALIRNGLARLVKGELVLTAAGQRLTMKSFRVFKDSTGRHRWVAQSSTAFQDRDREIVSTKALADDCRWADTHDNAYGPLRWWHTPGLDLGDCDFNAMHGRVLIESGTFRSATIAQKVARAAGGLEISLGFIHLPSEPDADGVFHHIRRFERSLVPRGKASNRFTAFRVKESSMANLFTPEKIEAMKAIGFTDEDIAGFSSQATTTEKTADGMLVASKADDAAEPELPDVVINGVTYKAFPPKAAASAAPVEGSPEEEAAETPEEEAAEPDAMMDDGGGLTLSPEDISAIGQALSDALTTALGPLVSTMDLTNKIGNHMNDLKTMMGGYQTKKDAEAAETAEQIAALTTKVAELTGDAPAAPYRPSAARDNVLTDATMLAAAKQLADPTGADPWADIKQGLGLAQSRQ